MAKFARRSTMETTDVLTAARRILKTVEFGFFVTQGETRPSVRMVGTLHIDGDLRITFATSAQTRKARELRSNQTAIYSVADIVPGDSTTGAAVCLYGTATIDEDLSRRRSAWSAGLARWFPDGPEGSGFILVTLTPERIEVWSVQDGIVPTPGPASAVLMRSAGGWSRPTSTLPNRPRDLLPRH